MPYVYKHRRPPEPWAESRRRARSPILLPFVASEFAAEWAAYALSRWSFLEVLEYAGSFSILIAVVFYFAEGRERTQARHDQAWQVINTAQGKGGSGGRIEALAALNEDHVPLVGVDLSDAFLQGVRLESANLLRADLRRADLRSARLAGSNLELANLGSANFRDADLHSASLRDVNLQDSDLAGANLRDADLSGAVLDRADLRNVDLSGVKNWQHNVSVEGALVQGVRNAPDGFLTWAAQNKAALGETGVASGVTSQPATP